MCLKYKVRTQEDKGAYADIFHPLAFWNIAVETHLLLAHSSGHRPGTQTTCNFNRKTPEPVGCELQLLNSVQRKFNSNFSPNISSKSSVFRPQTALKWQLELLNEAQRRAQCVYKLSLFCLPNAKSACLQHLPTRYRDPLNTAAMLLSSWPYVWRLRTYINDGPSQRSNNRSAQHGLPAQPMSWGGGPEMYALSY